MITADPPMTVTFQHFDGDDIRLVDPWWPGRLRITGDAIAAAKRGEMRSLTFDQRPDGWFSSPLTARFTLANASATYREVVNRTLKGDVYEFDCVSCTRDADVRSW